MSSPNPSRDFEGFKPEFFLYHAGGPWPRATFRSAADAHVWQEGNRGRPYADQFFIVNEHGERVTFDTPPRHPGHAYAILDALDRGGS